MMTRLTLLAGLFMGLLATTSNAAVNNRLIAWNGSSSAFVNSLYQAVLQRAPDPRGFQGWVANDSSGRLSRLRIFEAFVGSPEYRGKNPNAWRYRKYNVCYRINDSRRWAVMKGGLGGWIPKNAGPLEFGVAMAYRDYYELQSRGQLLRASLRVNPSPRRTWTASRGWMRNIPAVRRPSSHVTLRPQTVSRTTYRPCFPTRSSSINRRNADAGPVCVAAPRPRY